MRRVLITVRLHWAVWRDQPSQIAERQLGETGKGNHNHALYCLSHIVTLRIFVRSGPSVTEQHRMEGSDICCATDEHQSSAATGEGNKKRRSKLTVDKQMQFGRVEQS